MKEEIIGTVSAVTLDKGIVEGAKAIVAQAGQTSIQCQSDYDGAGNILKEIKAQQKKVSDFYKPLKEQAHNLHKTLCDGENEYLKPLKDAEASVKKLMSDYVTKLEEERRKAEEEARRKAQEQAEMLAKLAIESGNEALFDAAVNAESLGGMITVEGDKAKTDGVSYSKDWEIVVEDASKVPVALMGVEIRPVDCGAILKLVRASKGAIKIDGIKIVEKAKMIVRG